LTIRSRYRAAARPKLAALEHLVFDILIYLARNFG
jgi:hypothetical protein